MGTSLKLINNMKHLFVPYDIALMAKEKGFVGPCIAKYQNMENPKFPGDYLSRTDWDVEFINRPEIKQLAAPLYQQLIDWFREKYELVVFCEPRIKLRGYAYCPNVWKKHALHFPDPNSDGGYMMYKDYYKALNRAITEAFKLIK